MKNDLMPKNGKDFPSYKDLSDEEFVREAERLSNGYYHEYLREYMVEKPYVIPHTFETGTESCRADVGEVTRIPRMRTVSGCLTRRVSLLVLNIVFSLFAFAAAFVPQLPEFLFGWVKNGSIRGTDILFSLFQKGNFYPYFEQDGLRTAFGYITAGAFLLCLLLLVVNIVLSVCSLADKPKKEETFKKYPLTVLCVVSFVASALSAFGCVVVTGGKNFCYGGLWYVLLTVCVTVFASFVYRDGSKQVPVIRPKETWEVLR